MADDDTDDFGELDTSIVDRLNSLSEADAAQRAASLLAGLQDYELDEEDLDVLESVTDP